MRKSYSKFILFMSCFYANILYVSEYSKREVARSALISLIQYESSNAYNKEDIVGRIRKFIQEYPGYCSQGIHFCANRSLFEFLKYHRKEDYWPQEIPLEQSLSNSLSSADSQNLFFRPFPRLLPSPYPNFQYFFLISSLAQLNAQLSSLSYLNRNLSPNIQTRNLSLHGCGKTNLACAFICDQSELDNLSMSRSSTDSQNPSRAQSLLSLNDNDEQARSSSSHVSEKINSTHATTHEPLYSPSSEPYIQYPSSRQLQNLSSHGCGKTNFACAMTCNHRT